MAISSGTNRCTDYRQTTFTLRHVRCSQLSGCLPGKSDKDLLHKLKTCQEEADESTLWIEYLIEANIIPEQRLESLLDKSKQLTAIMTAATITISRRLNNIHH